MSTNQASEQRQRVASAPPKAVVPSLVSRGEGWTIHTLENGLQVVTVPLPGVYSASVILYVKVGSRYESDEEAGISHLVEHLAFKGTPARPTPREIALAIEGVGGVFNANTSKELTTYWAKVAGVHVDRVLDVLFDMVRHSLFRPEDLATEKQIILEEIKETLDIPHEVAALACVRLLFPNHPLGRDVAGSQESVMRLSRGDVLAFVERTYRPNNVVLSVAGAVDPEETVEQVAGLVADWSPGPPVRFEPAPPLPPGSHVSAHARPVEQVQLYVGLRGLSRRDGERYALTALNTLLGESMTSRLFLRLREELGVVYSVSSSVAFYADAGDLIVEAGTDAQHVPLVLSVIGEELARLVNEPVPLEALNTAKEYLKGRLLLSLEDTYANASWYGSQVALDLELVSPEAAMARLDAVTPEDVQRVAARLFRRENMVLSLVGPVDEEHDWAQYLQV